MMLNETYHKACSYATKLSPQFFTDIVHDAFVSFYDETQKNLFDEAETVVMKKVRKTFHKKYFHQQSTVVFSDRFKQNVLTPEDEYIEQEYGLRFVSLDEIELRMKDYEQYHRIYPKIHLN